MFTISIADLASPEQATAILSLLDAYAMDIMGGEKSLSVYAKENLITQLGKRNDRCVILARSDPFSNRA